MNEKNGPIIGSSEWIKQMAQTEAELKAVKANRQPVIHRHVSLDQADSEARERAKGNPTHGQTRELPVRWSTVGKGTDTKIPGS